MKRLLYVLPVLYSIVAVTGCGGNHTVKGQIVFPDGSPVPGLNGRGISFESVDDKRYSAVGTIDADARFELYSIKPGDGVRPGKYRVMIPAVPPPMLAMTDDMLSGKKPAKASPKPAAPIPAKYGSVETSGLEVVVDRNITDLKLVVEPAPQQSRKRTGDR
jgi:hypothetical protein